MEQGSIPSDSLLATLDVTSLYPNIPNNEGRDAIRTALNRYRPGNQRPSNESLIGLLRCVLSMDYFEFTGKDYLQIGGTAMSTIAAPKFAIIFMHNIEKRFVYAYRTQPDAGGGIFDDIFMICTAGKAELDTFVSYLNDCHPSIKFTADISPSTAHFLDTTIHHADEELWSTLFCKPMDTHSYMRYESAHQHHIRETLPYSEFLRICHICSKLEDYDTFSTDFPSFFARRGYWLRR